MAKYLGIIFFLFFFGCKINSKTIIQPEKLNLEQIKFNTVTKNIIFENEKIGNDYDEMTKIINYWFDNKVKSNGFDGSLNIVVRNIDINEELRKDYYKFIINLDFEFIEVYQKLNQTKKYSVKVKEYGDIKGNFSIKDQENISLNVMHKSLVNLSKKLMSLI